MTEQAKPLNAGATPSDQGATESAPTPLASSQEGRGMEAPRKVEWQPIETAPKVGPFLVGRPRCGDRHGWYAVTMYGIEADGRCWTWHQPIYGYRPDIDGGRAELPTHWMPLPDPPAPREEKP